MDICVLSYHLIRQWWEDTQIWNRKEEHWGHDRGIPAVMHMPGMTTPQIAQILGETAPPPFLWITKR